MWGVNILKGREQVIFCKRDLGRIGKKMKREEVGCLGDTKKVERECKITVQ